MTLRAKTAIVIGGTLISLIATLAIAGRAVWLRRFNQIEREEAQLDVERARDAIVNAGEDLRLVVADYAAWNDTYRFMEDRNGEFVREELPGAANTGLGIDLVVILDASGRVVVGKMFELADQRERPLSGAILDRLLQGGSDGLTVGHTMGRAGLSTFPDGPMLIAAWPILTSDNKGPSRGTMIMGRSLDAKALDRLAFQTRLSLTLHPLDDPAAPPDVQGARSALTGDFSTLVRPISDGTFGGYALLEDIRGQPSSVLRVRLPRTHYGQGQASLTYLAVALVLVGLTFGAVTLFLLERFVLTRVSGLAKQIIGIGAGGDASARASMPGSDELSGLADAVNQMLDALGRSQGKLKEIIEHSTNLFYSRTPDGELTYLSPQTSVFLDCEPEAARLRWSEFVSDHPANAHGIASLTRAIETGVRQPAYEIELIGEKGRRIWVEVNEAPMTSGGETVAIVGALTDITARKRAEDEARRLTDELFQTRKMEAVGKLAGGVAHDFNNLLAVIMGFSDLLLRDLDATDPRRSRVEEVRKAASRAAALTAQLLAFSRQQILQPRVLDINAIVADIQEMIGRLIGEDIEAVTILTTGVGRVKADPGQLEQVIVNLAVNARDAMPRGGKVTMETANVDLDESFARSHPGARPGPYVMLRVSDTGLGMSAETASRIFEPFFTTKEKGKGTGLGLSTVYGIVKQSDGYIEVESHQGQGSTFTIYLPRTEAAAEPLPAERSAEPPPSGSGTVLVVEDAEALRAVICETLEANGYEVLDAGSPEEALVAVPSNGRPIDLLLTDVVMPGMSGPELAARLSTLWPRMKIVFMSGYTDDAISQHGVLDPAIQFLQKPFSADVLLRKLGQVLSIVETET